MLSEECGAQAGCSTLAEALTSTGETNVYGLQGEVCFRVIVCLFHFATA